MLVKEKRYYFSSIILRIKIKVYYVCIQSDLKLFHVSKDIVEKSIQKNK
jgi:hypothetical protein